MTLSFFMLSVFHLFATYTLMTGVMKKIGSASQDFSSQASTCPQTLREYSEGEVHNTCIPPPTDHAAFYVPSSGAPPLLCLFMEQGIDGQPIGSALRLSDGRTLWCNYL
ncbi:MAG: hypothetical protein HYW48_10605 [Deltaproteobacteria bacterium]|nr:hypothetical protein [Deltaproteobacteria bacterium]